MNIPKAPRLSEHRIDEICKGIDWSKPNIGEKWLGIILDEVYKDADAHYQKVAENQIEILEAELKDIKNQFQTQLAQARQDDKTIKELASAAPDELRKAVAELIKPLLWQEYYPEEIRGEVSLSMADQLLAFFEARRIQAVEDEIREGRGVIPSETSPRTTKYGGNDTAFGQSHHQKGEGK